MAKQPEGDEADLLRAQLCGRGIDAFLKMMFQDNFIHGDLHLHLHLHLHAPKPPHPPPALQ